MIETLNYVWTVGGVLAISASCVFLAMGLRRLLKVKNDKIENIKLTNQGNVQSLYYLTVESNEPSLTFKILQEDVPLVELPEVESEEDDVIKETAPVSEKKKGSKKIKVDGEGAMKKGRALAGRAGAIASVLGLLGSIIPGGLGASLKSQADAARSVQTNAMKTMQAPTSAQRKVDALKSGTSKAGLKTTKKQPGAANVNAEGQAILQHSKLKTDAFDKPRKSAPVVARSLAAANYQAQTPEVSSGDSIDLKLRIGTNLKKYPESSFLYTLESKQFPIDIKNVNVKPVIQQRTLNFNPVKGWRYWLSPISSFFVFLLTVWLIRYYLAYIW